MKRTYFILNRRCRRVKIGRSIDPVARLRTLQTATADSLELVGSLSNDRESELHKRFRELRVRREWYVATDQLLLLVQRLVAAERLATPTPDVSIPFKPLFTADELAELLGESRRFFDLMVAEGTWPPADWRRSAKLVRWTRRAVVAGLAAVAAGEGVRA